MPARTSFTVLCVDDHAEIRLSFSLMLKQVGYRVLEAGTGGEALALAKEADLIILDVQLPDVGGFEVCRRIKADSATDSVPVILISGHFIRSEDMAGGLEGGGDVFLTKPVDPLVLLGQIKALGRIRQAELRIRETARLAEENRRRLRTVTDKAPVLIAQLDVQGCYTFVNLPYAACYRLTPDQMIGRRIEEVLGEDTYRPLAAHVCAALAGGRIEFEAEIPYADLGLQHFHVTFEPDRDEEGQVVGLVAAMTNVTSRKWTEAERDALLRRLQVQVERMPLGLVSQAPDLTITDWNPAAEGIFGFSRAEAIGKTCFDLLVTAEARPYVEGVIRRLLAGDMTAHGLNQNRTKNGRDITCEWYNTPLLGPGGDVQGILSMVVDVTERKFLEEQYRQAQRMEAVGQLAGGLAHDFNNLITIINGFADIVLSDLSEDDPQWIRLQEIKRAGEKAASLTQQLLAFSRKQILQLKVLDLNAVVGELEKTLRRAVGSALTVLLRCDPMLGRIKADPAQIRQVIQSLAVYAAEAMPHGGTLIVETRNIEFGVEHGNACAELRPGPYILLSLSDTGTGMTTEVKARVFEPFFTSKTERMGDGGLGLASVYGIVKQSGGHIEVESTPGAGTTFKIYLPRLIE